MATFLEHFGVAWNTMKPKIRNQLLQNSDLDDINENKLWEDLGKRQKIRIFQWALTGLTEPQQKKLEKEIFGKRSNMKVKH